MHEEVLDERDDHENLKPKSNTQPRTSTGPLPPRSDGTAQEAQSTVQVGRPVPTAKQAARQARFDAQPDAP